MRAGQASKTAVVMAWFLAWWLIYFDGERWIFRRAFGTQPLCEAAAESLRSHGIVARCAEIKSW
jgi:hypothetical protein